MIWFVAILVAVAFATELILFFYFDGKLMQMQDKLEKQDQIIVDLCKVIDKNFLKLANELNKTKEE